MEFSRKAKYGINSGLVTVSDETLIFKLYMCATFFLIKVDAILGKQRKYLKMLTVKDHSLRLQTITETAAMASNVAIDILILFFSFHFSIHCIYKDRNRRLVFDSQRILWLVESSLSWRFKTERKRALCLQSKFHRITCNAENVMQAASTAHCVLCLSQLMMHIYSHTPPQTRHWNWAENKAVANTIICFSAVLHSRVLPSSTQLITIIRKLRLHAATN